MRFRLGWLILLGLTGLSTAGAAASTDAVHIGATRLEPPVLYTTTERRVTFVNHSGRAVHIDFPGEAGQHHIVQVPGSIWAVFHRSGQHPYIVHFPAGGGQDLRGVVEVEHDQERAGEPPTCTGVSVMGVCLER